MKHQHADPSPGADFLATCPPPLPQDAQLAELMASLGASTLRAVIFDLDSKLCHESWQIDEYGETSTDIHDGGAITGFVTAMGTIAQLSQTSASETLIRQLNPRRCAFAWRIDERRVAVAEARYQLAQTGRRDHDAALLREHFIARMLGRTPMETVAAVGAVPATHSTGHGPAAAAGHGADEGARQPPTEGRGDAASFGAAARSVPTGWGAGLFALILVGLLAAAAFLITDHQMESLESERLRLRSQVDATMGRQLADVLAQGDYGEVQAELDTFAELGYFQDAVVTNAQQRVVALVGTVRDARIGNIFPADASGTATVVALRGRDQPGLGQLMTWGQPGSTVEAPSSQPRLLMATSLALLAALLAAGWWVARSRRQHGLRPGAGLPPPETATRPRSLP